MIKLTITNNDAYRLDTTMGFTDQDIAIYLALGIDWFEDIENCRTKQVNEVVCKYKFTSLLRSISLYDLIHMTTCHDLFHISLKDCMDSVTKYLQLVTVLIAAINGTIAVTHD